MSIFMSSLMSIWLYANAAVIALSVWAYVVAVLLLWCVVRHAAIAAKQLIAIARLATFTAYMVKIFVSIIFRNIVSRSPFGGKYTR